MKYVSTDVKSRICIACGLDPKNVRRLTIDLKPMDVAVMKVEYYLTAYKDLAEAASGLDRRRWWFGSGYAEDCYHWIAVRIRRALNRLK
jgi:hypothetical protein